MQLLLFILVWGHLHMKWLINGNTDWLSTQTHSWGLVMATSLLQRVSAIDTGATAGTSAVKTEESALKHRLLADLLIFQHYSFSRWGLIKYANHLVALALECVSHKTEDKTSQGNFTVEYVLSKTYTYTSTKYKIYKHFCFRKGGGNLWMISLPKTTAFTINRSPSLGRQ